MTSVFVSKYLSSIPWTTAVINETLRMIPPVGIHLRIAKELKSEIEVEGIKFRQGFREKSL